MQMIKTMERPANCNGAARLRLRVHDVTGTHHAELSDVDPSLRVSTVADTIAAQMALPVGPTPWALRTASTARYLDDVPIGETVEPGALDVELVLTPRAHLG
jgi:hypothetical protein